MVIHISIFGGLEHYFVEA